MAYCIYIDGKEVLRVEGDKKKAIAEYKSFLRTNEDIKERLFNTISKTDSEKVTFDPNQPNRIIIDGEVLEEATVTVDKDQSETLIVDGEVLIDDLGIDLESDLIPKTEEEKLDLAKAILLLQNKNGENLEKSVNDWLTTETDNNPEITKTIFNLMLDSLLTNTVIKKDASNYFNEVREIGNEWFDNNAEKLNENKIADIERRRQEELYNKDLYVYDRNFKELQKYGKTIQKAWDNLFNASLADPSNKKLADLVDYVNGRIAEEDLQVGSTTNALVQDYIDENLETIKKSEEKGSIKKLNDKYDSELTALKQQPTTQQPIKEGNVVTPDMIVKDDLSEIDGDFVGDIIEEGNKQGKNTKVVKINGTSERGVSADIRIVTNDGVLTQTVFLKQQPTQTPNIETNTKGVLEVDGEVLFLDKSLDLKIQPDELGSLVNFIKNEVELTPNMELIFKKLQQASTISVPAEYVQQVEELLGVQDNQPLITGNKVDIDYKGSKNTFDFTGFALSSNLELQKEAYDYLANSIGKENVDKLKGKVFSKNGNWLFNQDGKLIMFLNVGKGIIPVYFSSKGTSGKSLTWHPFFGIETLGGWFGKLPYNPDTNTIAYSTKTQQKELDILTNEMKFLFDNFNVESIKNQLLPLSKTLGDTEVFVNVNLSKSGFTTEGINTVKYFLKGITENIDLVNVQDSSVQTEQVVSLQELIEQNKDKLLNAKEITTNTSLLYNEIVKYANILSNDTIKKKLEAAQTASVNSEELLKLIEKTGASLLDKELDNLQERFEVYSELVKQQAFISLPKFKKTGNEFWGENLTGNEEQGVTFGNVYEHQGFDVIPYAISGEGTVKAVRRNIEAEEEPYVEIDISELKATDKKVTIVKGYAKPVNQSRVREFYRFVDGDNYYGLTKYGLETIKKQGSKKFIDNIINNKARFKGFSGSLKEVTEALTDSEFLAYQSGVSLEQLRKKTKKDSDEPLKTKKTESEQLPDTNDIDVINAQAAEAAEDYDIIYTEDYSVETEEEGIQKQAEDAMILNSDLGDDSRQAYFKSGKADYLVLSTLATKLRAKGVEVELVNTKDLSNKGLEGKITRGRAEDNTIYINTDLASTADLYHEYMHIWLNLLKQVDKNAYDEILDLAMNHPELGKLKTELSAIYGDIPQERLAIEAFVTGVGEVMAKSKNTKHHLNLWNTVKKFINKFLETFNLGKLPVLDSGELFTSSLNDLLYQYGEKALKQTVSELRKDKNRLILESLGINTKKLSDKEVKKIIEIQNQMNCI